MNIEKMGADAAGHIKQPSLCHVSWVPAFVLTLLQIKYTKLRPRPSCLREHMVATGTTDILRSTRGSQGLRCERPLDEPEQLRSTVAPPCATLDLNETLKCCGGRQLVVWNWFQNALSQLLFFVLYCFYYSSILLAGLRNANWDNFTDIKRSSVQLLAFRAIKSGFFSVQFSDLEAGL